MENLPKHIGMILDGNRRWAKEHGKTSLEGHLRGADRLRKVISHAADKGVHTLSFYCFSRENWNRPKSEVTYLMKLFAMFVTKYFDEFSKGGVRVMLTGDMSGLPKSLVRKLENAVEKTKHNTRIVVRMAINYTGRDEIVRAAKKVIQKGLDLTEETLSKHLDSTNIDDPDLIIRTSGEQRLSGFLLWQSASSELYFTETKWPDFTPAHLDEAISDYQLRQRRFGA